jgi:hypothetical protein
MYFFPISFSADYAVKHGYMRLQMLEKFSFSKKLLLDTHTLVLVRRFWNQNLTCLASNPIFSPSAWRVGSSGWRDFRNKLQCNRTEIS